MTSRTVLPILAVLATTAPTMAQDAGGLPLAPGSKGGPVGLARPLRSAPTPFLTARDLQGGMTAADHQAQNQAMISRLRGDGGLMAGFSFGAPLAASGQAQILPDEAGFGFRRRHGHGDGPIIINNQGPVAVTAGNGNVVQQQSASGSGPIAQQQVATTPTVGSGGGGATNLVTPEGNIVQRSPR
jgi:hypothetical protein